MVDAMSILGHIPLGVGIVLLALAAVIIWLRPSENSPLTVMFLAGVALIFLSDPRISNLKFGASGVEVIRDKLIETQQDVGAQIAALRSDVEKQKQILDQHQRLFEAKQPAPDAASRPAVAPA